MSAHITHHTGMPSCAYIASYFVACNCYAVIAASLNPTYDSPTIIRRRSTHLAVVEQTPLRQRCKQLPCHTNLHHGKPKLLGQADNMTSQAPQQTDWEIADQLPNSQLQQHGTAYTTREVTSGADSTESCSVRTYLMPLHVHYIPPGSATPAMQASLHLLQNAAEAFRRYCLQAKTRAIVQPQSLLQRRLRIPFSQARQVVQQLEVLGVLSPAATTIATTVSDLPIEDWSKS